MKLNLKRYKITRDITLDDIKKKALQIKNEVDRYANGGPAGNQNCQLCTWAMEMMFRGEDILPRPVYSPRDPIFNFPGESIVKNPDRIYLRDIFGIKTFIREDQRYYVHVTWEGHTGGHEFIIVNIGNEHYVIDGQVGEVCSIKSAKGRHYIEDIDRDQSYIVPLHSKEINHKILKYNQMKYLVQWDNTLDPEYLEKNLNQTH